MRDFKKFEFDNFVVGKSKAEEKAPEPVIEEVELEPVEEVVEVEEEPIVEITPEPAQTYTEEELAEKIKLAEERGYENGFRSSQEGLDAQNTQLLNDINNKLSIMFANSGSQQHELEGQAIEIARAAINKIVPAIEAENAKEIVINFLNENFKNFKDEAKLAFYFNPETISFVQETISRLANVHDFEGKISLHKDASLGLADAKIEWDNGGVERSSGKMLEKIDNLLEEAEHSN